MTIFKQYSLSYSDHVFTLFLLFLFQSMLTNEKIIATKVINYNFRWKQLSNFYLLEFKPNTT